MTGAGAPSVAEVLAGRGRHSEADGAASCDVVAIGNALVDVIGHVEDSFLDDHGLVKGTMALVDTDAALAIYQAMGGGLETSGGSAANTVVGVASLGGTAGFIGKVGADPLGTVFARDLAASGVAFRSAGDGAPPLPTGRCIIAVTPDAQRTMNTYLGASSHLTFDDVDADLVAAGAVLYMEGYLFDRDEAKQAFHSAASRAHRAGRVVSLTLSDAFCVDRHRDDFLSLISAEVDLLFGNESELLSLYETASFADAVAALRRDCHIAVVTRSEAGAVVVTRDEVTAVPAHPVDAVVDTTGAGDLFAAGFLRGFTAGLDLERCARLGAVAAAEVIAHVGPRPQVRLADIVPSDLAPGPASA